MQFNYVVDGAKAVDTMLIIAKEHEFGGVFLATEKYCVLVAVDS